MRTAIIGGGWSLGELGDAQAHTDRLPYQQAYGQGPESSHVAIP
jgi:hypothetical protein